MQFSDTTNKNGIIQDIEDRCGLGDAGISGQSTLLKQFTSRINIVMSKVWAIIFQSYGGWQYDDGNQTDLPEATTDLVAGQQNYALDSQMLTVNRVEVTDSAGNIRKLDPLPQEQIEGTGILDATPATTGVPQFYNLTAGVIKLIPAPVEAVTGGLAVYFERSSVEFTSSDTTATPGFAKPFHYLIPLGTSLDWMKSKQADAPALKEFKEDWNDGLNALSEYYQKRWRDYRPRINTPPTDWA